MTRGMRASLLLPAALALALMPGLAVAQPPLQRATVHPQVWATLQAEGEAEVLVVLRAQADLSGADSLTTKEAKGRYVYETLREVAERTQRGLRAALGAQGVDYQPFCIINAIKVRADRALVHSLAARSDVEQVLPNPWVQGIPDPLLTESAARAPEAIESNITRVNADDVWALGFTGQGVVVAGNDTGVQWDHPALKDQYRGWDGSSASHDFNWHDAISHQAAPYDDHGHGTHTLGIIAGDDGDSNRIGTAPGARWIGCKNMAANGCGTPATYLECFQFFLAPYAWNDPCSADPALAPHVVNNSWSCPPYEGCDWNTLQAAVQNLRAAGIVVVVSAGNEGSSCSTVINPPAIYQASFSVGAFSHSTGLIAGFSSRGPVTVDGSGRLKPDITAPGVSIRSSVPGGSYGYKSGTSMAAPHVAGAVALLLSAAPGYKGDVDAIEHMLTNTAEARSDGQCGQAGPPNNVWGWGILDALAAVEALPTGALEGTVSRTHSGLPIAEPRVMAVPAGGSTGPETVGTPAGGYTLVLVAQVYDVTAAAQGYLSQTVNHVVVISGQTTTLDFSLTAAHLIYLPCIIKEATHR